MNANKLHDEYEARAAILEAVASRYQAASQEHETIKLAALALYFATVRHSDEFSLFLKTLEQELTEKDLEYLRRFGTEE